MSTRKQQSGFAIVELLVAIIVLAAIAFAGWWVYQRQNSTDTTADKVPATSTQSPTATNVSPAPQVDSTSDLDKAIQTLDQNDPAAANAADTSQLSDQSSTF